LGRRRLAVTEARLATHALKVGAHLGEGPIWIDDALWFVDIKGRRIYRFDPAMHGCTRWDTPEYVGWVVPAARGGLVAGFQSGPHHFDTRLARFERLATIDADLPANRLNDACVDPCGRIWFGTMDNDEAAATGRLYRWDGATVETMATEPVVITNGPAIPPAGDRLYHVDTLGRRVIRHAVQSDGALGAGEVFLTFDAGDGYPDGAVCDAEGGDMAGLLRRLGGAPLRARRHFEPAHPLPRRQRHQDRVGRRRRPHRLGDHRAAGARCGSTGGTAAGRRSFYIPGRRPGSTASQGAIGTRAPGNGAEEDSWKAGRSIPG
jgi:xylono-1,5-lactonase